MLAAAACRRLGLSYRVRKLPCWRWVPEPGENAAKKFSRVKTHLNYFKRQGSVEFAVLKDPSEWQAFADPFYRQHSLRQLQTSRDVSFDDARKRRFYEALFLSGFAPMHVTACRVNGRMIAGHVGLAWRGVLMLGAPSISLEDEQRSPALILISWIIQNAAQLGLTGFDLTVGDFEFKRRLGNRLVELPLVEIYRRRTDYVRDRALDGARRSAKRTFDALLGPGAWESRIKSAAAALRHHKARLGEVGLRRALAEAAAYTPGAPPACVTYQASRTAVAGQPLADGSELHDNTIDDLLLVEDPRPSIRSALNGCARAYARRRAAGDTLHTLVRDGRLAAWCYSRRGGDRDRDLIVDQVTAPGGGADAAVLVRALARAAADAPRLRVIVAEDARSVRSALGGLGLRIMGNG
jgi:hypothetical protein